MKYNWKRNKSAIESIDGFEEDRDMEILQLKMIGGDATAPRTEYITTINIDKRDSTRSRD